MTSSSLASADFTGGFIVHSNVGRIGGTAASLTIDVPTVADGNYKQYPGAMIDAIDRSIVTAANAITIAALKLPAARRKRIKTQRQKRFADSLLLQNRQTEQFLFSRPLKAQGQHGRGSNRQAKTTQMIVERNRFFVFAGIEDGDITPFL